MEARSHGMTCTAGVLTSSLVCVCACMYVHAYNITDIDV